MAAAAQIPRLLPAGALALVAGGLGLLAGVDPGLAIVAALALAFVLVVLASLYAGVVLFILLSFLTEIPGLVGGGFTVAKFVGVLLAISWLAALTIRRERRADFVTAHPMATWILVGFLGWVALSQLWAQDPSASLDAAFRLSLNAILFLIIFTAVRTPQQAMGVVAAFVAGACLNAVYGLVNPVDVGNAARLAGSASKPGELAAALVAGLVLSLGLAAALRRAPIARLAVLSTAALCAAGVFFTGSRGGLIALAVALAAFIIVGGRWRGRMLVLTLVVAFAGVGFYNYTASPDLTDRVTTLGSGSGRVSLWTVGWRMVEENPAAGIGAGNFRSSSTKYALEPGSIADEDSVIADPQVAHNTYLGIWAETGLVGLTLFLLIVGFCLRSALQAAREFARQSDAAMDMISRALFVAMAGFLAGAFFTSREYAKDIWFVLALGPALLSIARASVEGSRPAEAASSPARGAGARS